MSELVRDFVIGEHARETRGEVERWTFAVHVPARLCYFEGHFEGHPVLPAVVQLNNLVLKLVRQTWPTLPSLRRVTKLKFRRRIAPASDVTVRLERRDDAGTLTFSIEHEGALASTGALHFSAEAP